MKKQDRVHREADSKTASAQARSHSATQAAKGLKTYRVFTAAAGETDMTKWQESGSIQARSPLDAARRHLREFKRLAVCRFNQGGKDYLFDLVKAAPATPGALVAPPLPPLVQLWDRLEKATREVQALHTVLIDLLDTQLDGGGVIVPGLQSLGWRTHAELASIHEAMRPLVRVEVGAALPSAA